MFIYWALAGFLVPVAILIVTWLQGGVFEWPYLGLILWPSWIIAAASDVYAEPPMLSTTIIYLTISIGLNVIWYCVLGAFVSWFFVLSGKEK